MVAVEIVSYDGTGDPAKDGCTAMSTVFDTNGGESGHYSWFYTYYQLKAKPKKWVFDHFEYTNHRWDNTGWSQLYDRIGYSNNPDDEGFYVYPIGRHDTYLCDGHFTDTEYGDYDMEEVTRCKAVFRKKILALA